MNLQNMRECDNSKIHISNNSLFSICLFIMLDTLLLGLVLVVLIDKAEGQKQIEIPRHKWKEIIKINLKR